MPWWLARYRSGLSDKFDSLKPAASSVQPATAQDDDNEKDNQEGVRVHGGLRAEQPSESPTECVLHCEEVTAR